MVCDSVRLLYLLTYLALLLQRAASATEPSGALLRRELELALLLQQQLELGHPRLVRKEAPLLPKKVAGVSA